MKLCIVQTVNLYSLISLVLQVSGNRQYV